LSLAQEVVLLQVYGARETPIPGVDSGALAAELRQMGVDVALCSRDEEAVGYVVRTVRSGDIIVTMGAGSVTNAAPKILTELNGVSVSVG
jgi:UDP-N-acetylmuramate--alanine ligase